MSKTNADRRFIDDVEITMTEGVIVESRLATLKPHQKIPNEVYAMGPHALAAYQDFLARASGTVAPHIVEHIEIASVA